MVGDDDHAVGLAAGFFEGLGDQRSSVPAHLRDVRVGVADGRAAAIEQRDDVQRRRFPYVNKPVFTGSRVPRSILEKKAMTIPARYENGVFRPLQDVPIKEGTVVEVHVPVEAPANKPRSIGDSPFAGMWKDREDMADSVEYINRLRRELHG